MNIQNHECSDCTSFYYLKPVPTVLSRPIDSKWALRDYLGALKMRFTLKRNSYTVAPGLYCINNPSADSEVLITSNYKLTFDILRKNLKETKAWIIVLDTKGINVWCAAGKGTFGTKELITKIESTHIKDRINHNRIIIPQLGTPGISAYRVKQLTDMHVKVGPVYAKDIPAYIQKGLKASAEMRSTRFSLRDRFLLTGVEVVYSLRYLLIGIALIAGINLIGTENPLSIEYLRTIALSSLAFFLASLSGTFLGPLLLPYLPSKSFAIKGSFIGFIMGVILFISVFKSMLTINYIAFLLLSVTLGSYFTLNFTGATTYTSLSGVKKEMKYALPAQISLGFVAISLLLISRFI